MSDAAVRPAAIADADEIAVVHVRSWQAAYQGLMPAEYLAGLDPAVRAARWRQLLAAVSWPRSGVLVVEAGAGIAGFAGYWPARDQDATLWVLQDNARARQFYSQAGWAPDGAEKTDDRDGFPLIEVRYRRSLA